MENIQQSEPEKVILERILSLKKLLENDQNRPLDLHELGICYFNIKNYEQAEHYLSALNKNYPDYLETTSATTLRIMCLVMEKKFEEAIDLIYERLKINNQDIRLLSILAYIYEKSSREQEAIGIHRQILDTEPENLNSLNSLGYLLTLHGEKKDENEAYNCLKKVIEKKPNHPAYLDSFGVFLAKSGKTESARKALMRALRMEPRNMEILDHLKELLDV